MAETVTRVRRLTVMALVGVIALSSVLTVPALAERLRALRRYLLLQPVYESAHFDLHRLEGQGLDGPTTLGFGPDDRLYVAGVEGVITVLEVQRRRGGFEVVDSEEITAVRDMRNHDDLGRPAPGVVGRLITGMALSGTASDPLIYVASSDPRLFSADLDTNSGVVSRLERRDGRWTRTDLVRGLPRSRGDHAPHAVLLDETRGVLLVSQGGNTNAGARSSEFFDLPEYALAAAVLEIDLAAITDPPYDLPTLDDEDRPGVRDENDPFGGNDGKNQAAETRDGPVRIYATGIRNAFDLLLTQRGLYTIDNGANQGWGGPPEIDRETGRVRDARVEGGRSTRNVLHYIREGGYYGHPNPVRADRALGFNTTNPQSPVLEARAREATRRGARGAGGRLAVFPRSTNGLAEYRGGLGHPPRDGVILAAGLDQAIHVLELDASGSRVVAKSPLVSKLGFGALDVATRGRDQRFPGTIWVTDHSGGNVWVLDPQRLRPWTLSQLIRDAEERMWMWVAARLAY